MFSIIALCLFLSHLPLECSIALWVQLIHIWHSALQRFSFTLNSTVSVSSSEIAFYRKWSMVDCRYLFLSSDSPLFLHLESVLFRRWSIVPISIASHYSAL